MPNRTLTKEDVFYILDNTTDTTRKIARKIGCSHVAISRIRNGRIYKDYTQEWNDLHNPAPPPKEQSLIDLINEYEKLQQTLEELTARRSVLKDEIYSKLPAGL